MDSALHKFVQSAGCVTAFPVHLLTEVLQHVPQQQRLRQCAMVSRTWALAAAQATVHVKIRLCQGALKAFVAWLELYAGQLLSLDVMMDKRDTCSVFGLQLPLAKLAQLQRLRMQHTRLHLPGDRDMQRMRNSPSLKMEDSSVAVVCNAGQSTLPNLQHLELVSVKLWGFDSLLQLTDAPQLRTLSLMDISFVTLSFESMNSLWLDPLMTDPAAAAATTRQVAEAMPRMLQQLPLLSVLQLPGFPLTDSAMQQVAAMQQLQELVMNLTIHQSPSSLQHLPSSITQLQLTTDRPYNIDSSELILPSALPQLSGLLHLELSRCSVPPTLLGGFAQLQVLHMDACNLVGDGQDDGLSGTRFLDVVSSMTSLKSLKLEEISLNNSVVVPQRCAALTASSHLTQLKLSHSEVITLPKGAVQHMFPVGRQMESLQHLTISTEWASADQGDADWCIDSSDLFQIIDCCPRLQSLDISGSVEQYANLHVLQQLPKSFTSLHVGGNAFCDLTVPVMLQLTQLLSLGISLAKRFTDYGFEEMLGCGLTSLRIFASGLSDEVADFYTGALHILQDPKLGSVSQQIDALCDISPNLAPARFKKHREAAAVMERELREQLAHSQAEVQQLKEQLAAGHARQLQ